MKLTDKDKAFYGGICVALQCISAYDYGSAWGEIVRACGFDNLKHYVTKIEPEEFELTKFQKYAKLEFGKVVHKPKGKENLVINESPYKGGIDRWEQFVKKGKGSRTIEGEYCTCYEKGNKPALLTDWRKTNICQSCMKPKREEERC